MEDKKKNYLEKRDLLVAKLKEILSHIENNETSLNGDERKSVMEMFKEVNETLLNNFDQASLSLFSLSVPPMTEEEIAADTERRNKLIAEAKAKRENSTGYSQI